jgi:SPP1 family phage portal protein
MEEVTEEVKTEQPATNNQDVDNSNAQIPTDTPTPVAIGPGVYRLFGRKVIYVDYKEEDINEKTIQEILTKVFHVHLQNANEIDYLEKYYKGYQPIIGKIKEVRPTINHTVVENNAYFVVEFKKSFVFGEPMQYIQSGDIANKEVAALNRYMLAENKYPKDTELAESLYISGIGHRLVLPDINEDSPFSIENLDSKTTFCVYSSYLPHKMLFACTYTKNASDTSITGSVYTKNAYYTFNKEIISTAFNVKFVQYHILGSIPIIEYYLNKSRLGIIEVIMDILNELNSVTSNEMDALEQYVQSIMVFVNQDIDKEDYEGLLDLGAVKINTIDPSRPADLKLLSNNLDHSNTKVLHDRLFNAALNIIGIPKNSDKASGGDTGEARLLGEGWVMADERAKQDEMEFKRCAKPETKLILRICKLAPNSEIKNLTIKDIDSKIPRNKYDNFLVKSQGLLNQINSGIAPDIAMTTSGLYSDSNEAFNKSMDFYGGVENWINLFVKKASSTLKENKEKADLKNKVDENEKETEEE